MSEEEKKNDPEAKPIEEESDALPDTEVIEATVEEEESLRDQFVRLQADFANFRNRTQRERVELYQRANEDLLLEFLPVLDHFELGLEMAKKQEADPAVMEGFTLVYDQSPHHLPYSFQRSRHQTIYPRFHLSLAPLDAARNSRNHAGSWF